MRVDEPWHQDDVAELFVVSVWCAFRRSDIGDSIAVDGDDTVRDRRR
jgi:hypothetical protein